MKNLNLTNWTVALVTGTSILSGIISAKPIYILYGIFISVLYIRHLITIQKHYDINKMDLNKEAFRNSLKAKYKKLMNNDHTLVEQGFIDGANHIIKEINK